MQDQATITNRFEALFGQNWKAAYSRATGAGLRSVRRFDGTTLYYAEVIIDLLEALAPKDWPSRFSEMRKLHYDHVQKGKT